MYSAIHRIVGAGMANHDDVERSIAATSLADERGDFADLVIPPEQAVPARALGISSK